MSLKATTWAWSVPAGTGPGRISPSLKLLLVALADFANDAGACWPSITRLAAMTGLQDRSIRRLLPELQAAGLATLTKQEGRNTRYTLHIGSAPEPRTYGPGCHTVRGLNGAPVKASPRTVRHPTPDRTSPEPSVTVRKEEPPFSPPPPKPVDAGPKKDPLPDWMPLEDWAAWEEYRAEQPGKRWNARIHNLSLADLTDLKRKGNDPAKVIRQAMAGGYTGFRALPKTEAPRFRDGFAQVLYERHQAREADAPPVNRFLIDPGSTRRDN